MGTGDSGMGWLSVFAALALLLHNVALAWLLPRRNVPRRACLMLTGATMAGVLAIFLIDRSMPPRIQQIALAIGLWLLYMAVVSMWFWALAPRQPSRGC